MAHHRLSLSHSFHTGGHGPQEMASNRNLSTAEMTSEWSGVSDASMQGQSPSASKEPSISVAKLKSRLALPDRISNMIGMEAPDPMPWITTNGHATHVMEGPPNVICKDSNVMSAGWKARKASLQVSDPLTNERVPLTGSTPVWSELPA